MSIAGIVVISCVVLFLLGMFSIPIVRVIKYKSIGKWIPIPGTNLSAYIEELVERRKSENN